MITAHSYDNTSTANAREGVCVCVYMVGGMLTTRRINRDGDYQFFDFCRDFV